MNCCITDLCEKEIINLKDGMRLGNVNDVEVDTCSGKIIAIIICSKGKFFGFGSKEEDFRICWDQIEVIGNDTILVNVECPNTCRPRPKGGMLSSVFRDG